MDRAFKSGAAATPPTAPASPSIGYASPGDAGAGVPPTKPGAWWFHAQTEELRNIIVAAGLTPNYASVNQVLTALQVLFLGMSSFTGSNVLQAPTGYLRLPGGLVIQWGGYSGGGFGPTMTFPLAFPTQCFAVVACSSNGGNSTAESVSVTSLTRFSFLARQVQSTGVSSAFYWIAIGV